MMTLDEAIKHCNEVACKHDKCSTEHKQLAQWLTELKSYRVSATQEEPIDKDKLAKGVLRSVATTIMQYLDANTTEGKMCLSNMECEDIENAVINADWAKVYRHMNKKLEKQDKNKVYTFKSIPRLLDMIEPTSKVKAYCQKLIDTLVKEGYATDAKIVSDCLKQMNGEKVAMATMDEKQDEQQDNNNFSKTEKNMKNWKRTTEETYQITLTKRQVQLLSYACDQFSRLICGQDWAFQNLMEAAWERRCKEATGKMIDKEWEGGWRDMRFEAEDLCKYIKRRFWGLESNALNGIHYDQTADILFDIHQVLRHQLWLDRQDEDKSTVTVDASEAMCFGDEPLIEIKKINNER